MWAGDRRTYWILLLIVAAGAALRFYGLAFQSLWSDELHTWGVATAPSLDELFSRVLDDHTPPVFPLLLHPLLRVFGDSETMLRLPSAVAGVIAIPLIYALGARLYSPREGLFAALFMALAWTPIRYSQEARNYTVLVVGVLASLWFWFSILRRLEAGERPRLADQLGYVVSAVVTEYTHYYGLIVIVLQGGVMAALFVTQPRALVRVLATWAPVALALVPWVPQLLRETQNETIWIASPDLDVIRKTWRHFFFRPGELKRTAALLCGAYLVKLWWESRHAPRPAPRAIVTSPTFLWVLWLTLPFCFGWIYSLLTIPLLHYRYLIVSMPAAYLLVAHALVRLLPPAPLQAVAGVGLASMLLYGLIFSGGYYTEVRKEQFREAAAFVVAQDVEAPGAMILARDSFRYYLRGFGDEHRIVYLSGREEYIESARRALDAERPERFWLILGHRPPDAAFLEFLASRYGVVRYDEFFGAWVRLYERRGDAS